MGLEHQPDPEDAEIWTAKTSIIRFNVVEMHHSDRVVMQFGMRQEIPEAPTCLSPWHQKRVDAQWTIDNWQNFAPNWVRMWRRRIRHVLQLPVFPAEHHMQHTRQYINWYRSVTNPEMFVSEPRYLVDPRTRWASTSNQQQEEYQQSFTTQQQYQRPFTTQQPYQHQTQRASTSHQTHRRRQPTNTRPQSQDPNQYTYMPHTQPQYHEQRQYFQHPEAGPSSSRLSPDMGIPEEYSPSNPTYSQPTQHSAQQTFMYQTPQNPIPPYPTFSDEQCYRVPMEPNPPPMRPNFENMGQRLFDSGAWRDFELTDCMDPERIDFTGPSTQPQQEPPRMPQRVRRGRSRRQTQDEN